MRTAVKRFALCRPVGLQSLSRPSRPHFPAPHVHFTPKTRAGLLPSRQHLQARRQYHHEASTAEEAPQPAIYFQGGCAMGDTKSISATSSGKKRKRTLPTYYAVKQGHKPDIYHSWEDARKQMTGHPDPSHQKFNDLNEAEQWMKTDSGPAPKFGKKLKYYGVHADDFNDVFTEWSMAQAAMKGRKRIKQKSFATAEEAWAFVANEQAKMRVTPSDVSASLSTKGEIESEASISDARIGCKVGDNASKRQKKNDVANGDFEPGMGPLPPDAEDGFDRTIAFNPISGEIEYKSEAQLNARKLQPTGEFSGPIVIYTDGSSLGNGKSNAVAGVGVYFGSNDPRNVSEGLPGDRQTNQRAELMAISRALDIAPINRDVHIYSDSNYAIKCVTEWFVSWRQHDWKTSSGKGVDNSELIKSIIGRIDERYLARAQTKFTWLKGHANDPGNSAADQLAVNGAREARQMLAIGQ